MEDSEGRKGTCAPHLQSAPTPVCANIVIIININYFHIILRLLCKMNKFSFLINCKFSIFQLKIFVYVVHVRYYMFMSCYR